MPTETKNECVNLLYGKRTFSGLKHIFEVFKYTMTISIVGGVYRVQNADEQVDTILSTLALSDVATEAKVRLSFYLI